MKLIVFICLLSISLCFSLPADLKAKSDAAKGDLSTSIPNDLLATSNSTLSATPEVKNATNPAHEATAVPTKTDEKPTNGSKVTDKTIIPTHENVTDKIISPTTHEKIEEKATTTLTNDTAKNTTVKPDDKGSKVTEKTTPKVVDPTTKPNEKPTIAPAVTSTKPVEVPTTEKPIHLAKRGFDGASFTGGIILALGLLAIGFVGFKYYKSRSDPNYHTL